MTDTAIALSLAMICLTYFVFINNRNVKPERIWKAESPLQPLLALWGLGWYLFVGRSPSELRRLFDTVVFGGYKAWTKWNTSYWEHSADPWGFTLCSFAVILLFFILLILSSFVVPDAWRPDSENGALRGVSPILAWTKVRRPSIMRLLRQILDAL